MHTYSLVTNFLESHHDVDSTDEITFRDIDFTSAGSLDLFIAKLSQYKNIKNLKFENCQFTPEQTHEIMRALRQLPNLEEVYLPDSGSPFALSYCFQMSELLRSHPTLKRVTHEHSFPTAWYQEWFVASFDNPSANIPKVGSTDPGAEYLVDTEISKVVDLRQYLPGRVDKCIQLIKKYPGLQKQTYPPNGDNILMYALSQDNSQFTNDAKAMIRQFPSLSSHQNKYGSTPLTYALFFNHEDVVRQCLEIGHLNTMSDYTSQWHCSNYELALRKKNLIELVTSEIENSNSKAKYANMIYFAAQHETTRLKHILRYKTPAEGFFKVQYFTHDFDPEGSYAEQSLQYLYDVTENFLESSLSNDFTNEQLRYLRMIAEQHKRNLECLHISKSDYVELLASEYAEGKTISFSGGWRGHVIQYTLCNGYLAVTNRGSKRNRAFGTVVYKLEKGVTPKELIDNLQNLSTAKSYPVTDGSDMPFASKTNAYIVV